VDGGNGHLGSSIPLIPAGQIKVPRPIGLIHAMIRSTLRAKYQAAHKYLKDMPFITSKDFFRN
jgi:hypothetical protein